MNQRRLEIESNLVEVEKRIAKALEGTGREREEVTLIVVTKTYPVEDVFLLYDLGVRNFGENRDQEGAAKAPQLPNDASWHFQGQIQGRKISSINEWSDVIHSLDSLDHAAKFARLEELSSEKAREFFLQINLESAAEHRGGIAKEELESFLENCPVSISGLMVVAPLEVDPYSAFSTLSALASDVGIPKLSMGMSGDFEVALKAGATHIRVGSSILGSRTLLA